MELHSKVAEGFSYVGLNTPTQRFFAFAALGGALEYQIRPSFSYQSDGSPRPWAVVTPGPNATYLPPGSTALVLAGLVSLFF